MEETIAVSSQMMNRNNHRIVLEEILKVNDVKRKDLPKNIDSMAPAEQVSAECRSAMLRFQGRMLAASVVTQFKT